MPPPQEPVTKSNWLRRDPKETMGHTVSDPLASVRAVLGSYQLVEEEKREDRCDKKADNDNYKGNWVDHVHT